ncbi:MAG: hypothetical protein WC277_10545 [Bacilli bacterium]|jgi:hypothetical protein
MEPLKVVVLPDPETAIQEIPAENLLQEAFRADGAIRDLQEQIKILEGQIAQWTVHREKCIDQAEELNQTEQGSYSLEVTEKSRTTRTIIPKEFFRHFPDEFVKVCTIPIGKAEKAVGGKSVLDTSGCVTTSTAVTRTRSVRYQPRD